MSLATNHELYADGRIQAINEFGIYLTDRYRRTWMRRH